MRNLKAEGSRFLRAEPGQASRVEQGQAGMLAALPSTLNLPGVLTTGGAMRIYSPSRTCNGRYRLATAPPCRDLLHAPQRFKNEEPHRQHFIARRIAYRERAGVQRSDIRSACRARVQGVADSARVRSLGAKESSEFGERSGHRRVGGVVALLPRQASTPGIGWPRFGWRRP